jgi:(2Fe-2S) ferredoxin
MSHFQRHVFFCCNQRDGGRDCCADHGAARLRQYAKARVEALGLPQAAPVRVNQAGCLGRCELGPVLVVYPEATWYTYLDESDIDEIVDEHLVHGRTVARLRL